MSPIVPARFVIALLSLGAAFLAASGSALAAGKPATNSTLALPLTHKVRPGDSLSELAARYYWYKIWEANKDKIPSPDLIYPGDHIMVPSVDGQVIQEVVTAKERTAIGTVLWATADGYVRDTEQNVTRPVEAGATLYANDAIELDRGVVVVKYGETTLLFRQGTTAKLLGRDPADKSGYWQVALTMGSVEIHSANTANVRVLGANSEMAFESRSAMVEVVRGVATRISVYHGKATITDVERSETHLAAGQGLYVSEHSNQPWVVRLPAAPTPQRPGGVVGDDVVFAWEKPEGVDNFVLRFGRQDHLYTYDFSADIFGQNEFRLTLRNKGKYYWQIRSIDKLGFMSRPDAPITFDVQY